MPQFWKLLYLFWNEDQVNEWRRKIFPNPENPNTAVDEPFNLICLAPDAHDMWNDGEFALKPLELSSDNTELTVQFFWQVRNMYDADSRIDLLTEPASSKGLNEGDGRRLFDYDDNGNSFRTSLLIQDHLTGRTTVTKLGSVEMQWYLHRLVAMSGAAGWPILEWDDDDNSIPCLNPIYANGNANITFQDVYEWIPSPLPPLDPEPDVATYTPPVECL